MESAFGQSRLSPMTRAALKLYDEALRVNLECEHAGEAVAIHPASGDYAVAPTHRAAARALLERHANDRGIVTLTIGQATPADIRLAMRMGGGAKS